MKSLTLTAALAAALFLCGCESSVSDDLHRALGPREEPKVQVYPADMKATYDAAKRAAEGLGFHVTKGGPAQGWFQALSEVSGGEMQGSSRQVSMKVTLSPAGDSGTQLELSMTEILESDSDRQPGQATQTPLLDTPMAKDFLRNVGRELSSGSQDK